MAVFRVERNTGYTVMSNHHLRNKELSLKAKGLLSQMLSLPEDWDYTLAGLSYINREKIDAIREAVRELERAGYIQRSRERDEKGRLRGTDYIIYEQPPNLDLPTLENPTLGNPTLENPGNVKKCAVGKHPKSEKHGNTAQFSEVERSGTQENCGGIGSGCRLRLRPLPVLRRRQSQRVARIDPNAVVVDKNIAENDRFDLFSR